MTTPIPLPRRTLSRRWLLAGVPAAGLVLAGCGSESTSSSGGTSSATATASSTATADGAAAAGSVAALAQAFYATLDDDQKTATLLDYSLSNAARWSNLPQGLIAGGGSGGGAPGGGSGGTPPGGASGGTPPSGAPGDSGDSSSGGGAAAGTGSSSQSRVGINLGTLSDDQLTAFDALLKAATGTKAGLGYAEITAHLAADDYLSANGGGDTYGRSNFYVALLGSPQDSGTWEFQFGGHHLAVANTYVDGVLTGATPSFRGIEPNGDFTQDGKSYNALKVKESAFTALLAGLSSDQLASAKLSDVYSDLVLGPGKDWAFPTDHEGVQVSGLSTAQKKLVLAAMATYVDDIADDDAAKILARYASELDDTYVAYSGTTALTEKNDYVRIDGPSVWIEFSMQNGIVLQGNHPHSVWRDRTTDYGGTKS
ncbi:DUF3500 domain-containing protein [Nocardioides sp. Kera G14]|uniref:DUF3500 domain-containing protein n=1 Tax=Nocardioides sp. Kera G14 TaxID=2884264 RepID=UPI001D11BDA0|nr:DUF3500 domain-containing protein [Nocardioides sp. Kera G14]UDY22953.1 DUF3500 domain-containing protein [Nocardioides sp. Kera G14]